MAEKVKTNQVIPPSPVPATLSGNPFDVIIPADMAMKAEEMGVKKATMDVVTMFSLAILAGAFVAMGAVFATTVGAGSISVNGADGSLAFRTGLPYGVVRLLIGIVFSLGLILVIVAGAELFTGNNLIVMAFASGKVSLKALLINWGVVYAGNFVGSISTAVLIYLTKQYTFGNGAVGLTALSTGEAKTSLEFLQAIALGIACNALVCLAVWLCLSARSTSDRILAIIPPITAFVAAGFEHSVANMYFIPFALMVKYFGSSNFFSSIGKVPEDFPHLTVSNFLVGNLLPVTVGNIIGGTIFVGLVYWFIYRRPK